MNKKPMSSERETDLGGTPTHWEDPWLLARQVATLIKHGNDPAPYKGRLHELLAAVPDSDKDRFQTFLDSVDRYLAAVSRGSVHSDKAKHEIEAFDFREAEASEKWGRP